MAIGADFSVDRSIGEIEHTSGATTYTVLELHRWLQDLADDASSSGDDELDITDTTPSDRSTDNIITLVNGYYITDTAAQFLYDGSITQDDGGGETTFAGLVVVGTLAAGNLEIIQNNTLVTDTWTTELNADATQNIIMRHLIKVKSDGTEIDGRRLRVQSREIGYTYDEFSINGTSLGNNVAAISTTSDLNNQTVEGTIGGWTITNTEGYQGLDVDADGSDEYYYSQWDPGSQSVNDTYEYSKYIMREGTAETIHGISGALFRGITHTIDTSSVTSGPYTEDEIVSWGSGATAGTGLLLANDTSGTKLHIQHLTGAAPTAITITGDTSGAYATASTITARTVSKPSFLGTSTGSNIIGAYGIGFVPAELSASDTLTDLDGSTVTPPNNVTFTVAGLVSGEDRVLVTAWDGSSADSQGNPVPDIDQLSLSGTLTGASVSSIVVAEAIPSDTPSTGVIRVINDDGFEVRCPYDSWATSTFTLTGTHDFSGNNETEQATTGNDVYIAYIDELASGTTATFTSIYNSDRNLMVRVRDGDSTPIKTFVTSATLGSAGGSSTAIRTSDA